MAVSVVVVVTSPVSIGTLAGCTADLGELAADEPEQPSGAVSDPDPEADPGDDIGPGNPPEAMPEPLPPVEPEPEPEPVPVPALPHNVWPIGGSTQASRLSSTFGPRIQGSSQEYDFHRGIDIPVPIGTPLHATAAGEVVIAGTDSRYPDPLIQIEHCADDTSPSTRDPAQPCQTPYFSNYLHVSAVQVSPGDHVELGQIIGSSGAAVSGFAHLHFEIRYGDSRQKNAIHPLELLPHEDGGAPSLVLEGVDFTDPTLPRVAMTVTHPALELDLLRVEAEIHDGPSNVVLASQNYDVDEWNEVYTDDQDPNIHLDYRFFNGVTVDPEEFTSVSNTYEVFFRFRRLPITIPPDRVRVVVRATDVAGNVSSRECYPCM